jgi:predicted Zn finger-like uncharacterized protein
MIIACKYCARKFKIADTALKPSGSTVRCSKCRKVFRAYPGGSRPDLKAIDGRAGAERRRSPRIPVSIPALCSVSDPFGNAMDLALIKDISKSGIALELFTPPIAEVVSVSLVGADKREIQISGRIVHSARSSAGKMKLGLSLTGAQTEIRLFLAKAAEAYRLNLMHAV